MTVEVMVNATKAKCADTQRAPAATAVGATIVQTPVDVTPEVKPQDTSHITNSDKTKSVKRSELKVGKYVVVLVSKHL